MRTWHAVGVQQRLVSVHSLKECRGAQVTGPCDSRLRPQPSGSCVCLPHLREGIVLGQLGASFHSSAKWAPCQNYDPGHPCQVSRLLSCYTPTLGGPLLCLTSSETNQTEESWLVWRMNTLLCTHFWRGDEFLWIFFHEMLGEGPGGTSLAPTTNSQGGTQHRAAQCQLQQALRPKRDMQGGSLKASSDCGMCGRLWPAWCPESHRPQWEPLLVLQG